MKSVRVLIFILSGVFALHGCSLLKGNKKPERLELRYPSSANINYGWSFDLSTYVIYSNKKEREVTGKEELQVTVTGGIYSQNNGRIFISGSPTKLSSNVIYVSASYVKEDVSLQAKLEIPFNYKGNVELNFRGAGGTEGIKGGKGSTALLFRDGKEGDVGGNGTDGKTGNNLSVYIWKDSVDFYFIRVQNLSSSQKYIYKIKNTGYAFTMNVSGGAGGKGGEGGEGGDGKDGSVSGDKVKEPGDGGKGGPGGNGGNGGNGGDVYVFIHPNAADIQPWITVYNFGGASGAAGDGGKGGKAGTPVTGQTAASEGSQGIAGASGFYGTNGNFQVLVEEFDIEY